MGFNAVTWDLTFTNRDQPWDLNGDVIPKNGGFMPVSLFVL